MIAKFDFSGWATKNDLKCSDGRTIRQDAFKDDDGRTVPLVWQHQHDDPGNVLGHAILENRKDGVYAYCVFNETDMAKNAKELVKHGDVNSLSIYANKLKQKSGNVLHGCIREVSLVLAGANPGAFIDNIAFAHGDESETSEEACIYTGEKIFVPSLAHSAFPVNPIRQTPFYHPAPMPIIHADMNVQPLIPAPKTINTKEVNNMPNMPTAPTGAPTNNKTIADIFNSLTDEQKQVVYYLVGTAASASKNSNVEGDSAMKHNVFENDEAGTYLSHADMEEIIADGKRCGSLRESVLQHGIEDIDILFPDATAVDKTPGFINNDDEWVSVVMSGTHHTPFTRIKSIYADIREDEARALGYIKGNKKKDEVFTLLKRVTSPTTIYKKQSLHRDDVVDITDFDVVAWIKGEMRTKLNEEIARAILIGDGRLSSSDDKISEDCIRPIWTDADLYTIKQEVVYGASATDDDKAKALIRAAVLGRKNYRGTGNPVLFTTEDELNNMLLAEDTIGRRLYNTMAELCSAMRVKDIHTVPYMESLSRTEGSDTYTLKGIIVNLSDYTVGADKGGNVSLFDDFDIDYNAQKYLIETRCSGSLTKPYSAIALEVKTSA